MLDMPQPLASYHLDKLLEAGLVQRSRGGQRMWYWIYRRGARAIECGACRRSEAVDRVSADRVAQLAADANGPVRLLQVASPIPDYAYDSEISGVRPLDIPQLITLRHVTQRVPLPKAADNDSGFVQASWPFI